ncbi:MAG: glycosyltransferase family 4 protein [Planctomycetes bacterium]|nr:glycosyltransferase family 4 protein [Planctomycetota bacterium]
MKPLRVGIDARLVDGLSGGVQQVVIGLANALSKLEDGDEEYLFLVHPDASDWIRPYLRRPCSILNGPESSGPKRWKTALKSMSPKAWTAIGDAAALLLPWTIDPPDSTGHVEAAGIDVMHFTVQSAFRTALPNIYQPHDLQHVHLPHLFTRRARRWRERNYRTFCDQATLVSVMSEWGRQDMIQRYGLSPEKICIVPWAPLLDTYPPCGLSDLTTLRRTLELPDAFIFYPAQTWKHKNHLGLIEALRILRDQDRLVIPLVSSGHRNDHTRDIERVLKRTSMEDQVRLIGFVAPQQLVGLYKLARAMVFPSFFEGWGLPILEAFQAGTPVACSDVTCLPQMAGDAALIFDPSRPEMIAEAVKSLWTDGDLRNRLIERGRIRAAAFSWDRSARLFRAHYRRIAGRPLSERDRDLLAAPATV